MTPPDTVSMSMSIRKAASPEDYTSCRALIIDYYKWLAVDLQFQDIETELAQLPGPYAEPTGCMLLASATGSDGRARDIGVVAVRPLPEYATPHSPGATRLCEMKRLYVSPEHAGRGVGRALVDGILAASKELGYEAMYLDTLQRLEAANALYSKLGFSPCPPYYDNPLDGVVYLTKRLQ